MWSSQSLGSGKPFLLAPWFHFPVPLHMKALAQKEKSEKVLSWKLKGAGESEWGGRIWTTASGSCARSHLKESTGPFGLDLTLTFFR